MPLVELSWNLKWLKWTWNERSPWKNIVHYWFEYEMDQSKVCQHLMQNRAQSFVLNPPPKGFLHDSLVTCNRFIDDTLHSSSPLPENNDRTSNMKHPIPNPSQNKKNTHFHVAFASSSQTFFPHPKVYTGQYPQTNQHPISSNQKKKTPASHVFLVYLAPQPLATFDQPISREGLYKDTVPLWRASLIRRNKVLELRGKCCEVVPSGQKCPERNFGRWMKMFHSHTKKPREKKSTKKLMVSIHIVYMYNIDFDML